MNHDAAKLTSLRVACLGVEEADGAVVVADGHRGAAYLDVGDFRPPYRVCLVDLMTNQITSMSHFCPVP